MQLRLLLGLLLILGFTKAMPVDVSQAPVGITQVPIGVADDDPYMLEFMRVVKTDLVRFKDGALKLYVEPSRVPALFAALGATCLGCLALCGWVDGGRYNRDQHNQDQLIAGGCALGAIGLAWLAIQSSQKKGTDNPPYIVLNNEGIVATGVAKVKWSDIERFEREKLTVYDEWGSVVKCTEVVHFKNKFRMTLLSVSNYCLPISHDNFVTLVEHYWQCNTGGVIQNCTDVKSELSILPDGNLRRV